MKCLTKQDEKTTALFLSLPKRLYKKDCPQDKKTEREILNGRHILSNDIEVYPFVVVDKNDIPLCRALLTCNKDDTTAYVGFFEAYDNSDATILLFDNIVAEARKNGISRLIGPIDSSIYIGYRFKTNLFDDYFTGEPYNKPYYAKLWQQSRFTVCDSYSSYKLHKIRAGDSDEKLERIYQRCLHNGYEFSSLQKKDFDVCLKDVYGLMMNAFSSFVGYKKLTEKQFVSMFSYLKYILDFDMVKLVHKNEKLSAFCICLPNYKKLTLGKMTLFKMLRLLKKRKNPDEYVVMYLGADGATCGVGSALVHYLQKSIFERQCTSIAALIKDGSVSEKYYKNIHTKQYSYVLLSRDI